ncbi:hypothetical protein D3C80_1877150 [compost metagenome]
MLGLAPRRQVVLVLLVLQVPGQPAREPLGPGLVQHRPALRVRVRPGQELPRVPLALRSPVACSALWGVMALKPGST